ncbi:MerR family transcriptional regulator [Alpinimonas psychrophila]|uniref:DNA-binding transcriptional MerR regulator n=1 Tax=Alpinimonas psychrophila TaxID=748908 RepID=A0A7W3JUE0_9MICO|nr:MerR family transcriptional regulator [Alpinimonas psychrophila]MBA8829451.1 DNA-binding transcriptional MerR regulator [Alpinimonas psychrophila]
MANTASGMHMHIGELAEKTGLSLRTIRHYDEIGLLKASGRTEGGFRLYTPSDVTRLMLIRRMKPLGFSLEQMMDLLRIIDALQAPEPAAEPATDATKVRAELRAELQNFIQDAAHRRETLEKQLGMADEFLELLRGQ